MYDASLIMVPGLGGSGPEHWQRQWLAGFDGALAVEQADWDRPQRDLWVAALDRAVRAAARPAILIAHSLGCALVAHWAERHGPGAVAGALLVAPADVDSPAHTPPETRGFAPLPLDPLPFAATVVASDDDPYVALARARGFAFAWQADFVSIGRAGHINAASGLGAWPQGRTLLGALMQRIAPKLAAA
ncbi:MAG: alpha/beta hydrolase [Rhodospirillaceae bacterium]|nr:alpha/beta hydrolase [Rhodospirillaceae bacterium]